MASRWICLAMFNRGFHYSSRHTPGLDVKRRPLFPLFSSSGLAPMPHIGQAPQRMISPAFSNLKGAQRTLRFLILSRARLDYSAACQNRLDNAGASPPRLIVLILSPCADSVKNVRLNATGEARTQWENQSAELA